jgi:hypothetical protein
MVEPASRGACTGCGRSALHDIATSVEYGLMVSGE